MEFETRKSDYITLKFNRKRTIPVTILLRAMAAIDYGSGSDCSSPAQTEILRLFENVDDNPDHQYILTTIRQEGNLSPRDKRSLAEEALLESIARCAPAIRPPWTMRAVTWSSSCPICGGTTWRVWDATS